MQSYFYELERGGGYRKMFRGGGCKNARSASLHTKTKKQKDYTESGGGGVVFQFWGYLTP